jgi:hypothetical protein
MKRIVISTAVIGLAVAGIGTATAGPDVDKVTGGGQIIVDTQGMPTAGPGDTIAFNAQLTRATHDADDAADGQLQFVERDGAGRPTDQFHGEVLCLVVNGSTATFAGRITTAGDDQGDFFQVDLTDGGEGAATTDTILLTRPDKADCDPSEAMQMQLGRGNVQVHDAE